MDTILIAGGTGLIGKHLTKYLLDKGYTVNVLSRKRHQPHHKNLAYFTWNVTDQTIDYSAFDNVRTIINLAGSNIGTQRWTKQRQQSILDSRTQSTQLLFDSIKRLKLSIDTYISASAIGYYGSKTVNKTFVETDQPDNDFLAEVCKAWEAKALLFQDLNVRTVLMRTGVVFDAFSGAFPKIYMPIKRHYGAVLGSGEQIIPWVHIDDIVRAYAFMIENELSGAYNIVAPNPVSNKNLTHEIASVLKRHIWLPHVPEFVLKVALGKLSTLVLEGSAVSCEKLLDQGFEFKYPKLQPTLQSLLFSL